MSNKNGETRLWQKVKKGLTDCFLTRIESSTINGIPDVHAVMGNQVFWIEMKSDSLSYPKLNKWQIVWINKYIMAGGKVIILKETLLQKSLKLYRPVSVFTDPRSRSRLPRSRSRYNGHWSSSASFRSWDGLPMQRDPRSRSLATDLFPLCLISGLGSSSR